MYTYVLCPSPSFYAAADDWHHSCVPVRSDDVTFSRVAQSRSRKSTRRWKIRSPTAEGRPAMSMVRCPFLRRVNKANTLARRLAENESRLPLERVALKHALPPTDTRWISRKIRDLPRSSRSDGNFYRAALVLVRFYDNNKKKNRRGLLASQNSCREQNDVTYLNLT